MILNRVHIRLITIVLFFIISLSNGLLTITPSDPLQYVLPIYDNNIGFEFIDRITLFYFFKFYNLLNLPPILIGSLVPLTIWIGIYILLDKILIFYSEENNSQIILSFLFCNSVFILSLSQYIYPTIFLVFFELIIFYLVFISKSHFKTYLIPIIFPFLIFSKIQSVGFIIFILILGYFKNRYTKNQIPILLFSLFIFITFFIYLNPESIKVNDYLLNQYTFGSYTPPHHHHTTNVSAFQHHEIHYTQEDQEVQPLSGESQEYYYHSKVVETVEARPTVLPSAYS